MIESIRFRNFKALRDTTLPLGRMTVLVGPNGSGKSTALQALEVVQRAGDVFYSNLVSVGRQGPVEVTLQWSSPQALLRAEWKNSNGNLGWYRLDGARLPEQEWQELQKELMRIRVYRLDADAIAAPVGILRNREVASTGQGLANVLDRLRDKHPERFDQLTDELGRFLPEYDGILLDVPTDGVKEFLLRTREGHHSIPASSLSQGTLFALALLTLANLPELPPMICIEEPDRGIHPRLLRRIQDVLYRLSHPEASGEKRPPVQVVATTQSPYFLDLYKEHPEEVVIAEKKGLEVRFTPLKDHAEIDEILSDAPLGEVWYSGVLGGIPVGS